MWVILRANWFVEGHRVRRGNPPGQPVEVPDHLRDRLPRGARIVEAGEFGQPPLVQHEVKTFTEVVRGNQGKRSMVDFLKSNPKPKPEPSDPEPPLEPKSEPEQPKPEPKPEPELGPEPEPEEDVDELLKAAKAAGTKKPRKK